MLFAVRRNDCVTRREMLPGSTTRFEQVHQRTLRTRVTR